jgi:TM2 domain-containing membrane protein YozV
MWLVCVECKLPALQRTPHDMFGSIHGTRLASGAHMATANNSHSLTVGYLLWLVGFTGAHRFYYGRPFTGTLWFFTLGLFGIGWIIDLFLIPQMDASADSEFVEGGYSYNTAWILLTFLGLFGAHQFYLGKWFTGMLYLLTGGLFAVGYLWDYWTLNEQVSEANTGAA